MRLNIARGTPDRSYLPRYVEVNVPGFELHVVERGEVVLRSRVIVGEKDNETPIFDDWIRYIEVNPSWYVPTSIVPELLEKEAKRPGYLASSGFYWRGSSEPGARRPWCRSPGRRMRSAGSSSCSPTTTPSTCTTPPSAGCSAAASAA